MTPHAHTSQPEPRWAAWLSAPNAAAAEIVRDLGYGSVVLDIEHGAFDLVDLERFIPFLRALGLRVLAKVLAPERGPIQQALDFGADVVVIPHVENLAHAKAVCAYGKFPPRGDRSFAGGRTARYGGFDDAWVTAQDAKTRVYPMIEDAGALYDIDAILALDTVDGVFVGPSDLSLRRERGAYSRNDADFADLRTIADAARRTGGRLRCCTVRDQSDHPTRDGVTRCTSQSRNSAPPPTRPRTSVRSGV
jgi:4-hydroxy-2-oxoheptanedioate aldolase